MNEEASRLDRRGKTTAVVWQLVREMVIPFILAACWTLYSLVVTPEKRNLVDGISVFGGSFFLACWAFAQWFRVKKQQAVESGLGGIVEEQKRLLSELRAATERLEGHSSGGKSIGWLMLVKPQDGVIRNVTAHVVGDYPLVDSHARVVDLDMAESVLDEFRKSGLIYDFFKRNVSFNCGTLQPNMATLQHPVVPCDMTRDSIRLRVEWTARNGRWDQYVELKRQATGYKFYTAVKRGEDWVFESPKREHVPLRADGSPDVFWHTSSVG